MDEKEQTCALVTPLCTHSLSSKQYQSLISVPQLPFNSGFIYTGKEANQRAFVVVFQPSCATVTATPSISQHEGIQE